MVIKNLTCKSQKLVVKEIIGDHREYDMIFQPNSTSELDRLLAVVHPEEYSGIFEFGGCICQEKVDPVDDSNEDDQTDREKESDPEDNSKENDTPNLDEEGSNESNDEEGSNESNDEEGSNDGEKAPDSFICELCGAEFASSRGLTSHKNRAHAQ